MSGYRLHDVTSTRDPRFFEAIAIYVDHTDRRIATPTNEIAYWLDQYTVRFPDDRLHVLALMDGERVIGFCQMVVFRQKHLAVLDYLTIAQSARHGAKGLFTFVRLLTAFMADTYPDVHIVTEVAALSGEQLPKLLLRCDFEATQVRYQQPRLHARGRREAARLYLRRANDEPLSHAQIAGYVYTEHYLRWLSVYHQDTVVAQIAEITELNQSLQLENAGNF